MPPILKATDYLKITIMNNKTYFCILKILHETEQCPYMFLQQSYSSNAEGVWIHYKTENLIQWRQASNVQILPKWHWAMAVMASGGIAWACWYENGFTTSSRVLKTAPAPRLFPPLGMDIRSHKVCPPVTLLSYSGLGATSRASCKRNVLARHSGTRLLIPTSKQPKKLKKKLVFFFFAILKKHNPISVKNKL